MNKDRIAFANAPLVQRAAYATVSCLQDFKAAEQVLGCALLLRKLCELKGLDVHEMLYQAGRVARDAADHYPVEARALETYIREEIH